MEGRLEKTACSRGAQVCASADQLPWPVVREALRPCHGCYPYQSKSWPGSQARPELGCRIFHERLYLSFQTVLDLNKKYEVPTVSISIQEKRRTTKYFTWSKLQEFFCTCSPCCVATWKGCDRGRLTTKRRSHPITESFEERVGLSPRRYGAARSPQRHVCNLEALFLRQLVSAW